MSNDRTPDTGDSSVPSDGPVKQQPPQDQIQQNVIPSRPSNLPKQIDKYRILDWLGKGGCGVVYKAVDPHTHDIVAIKVVLAGRPSARQLKRFRREAEILARLDQGRIVRVHDDGSTAEFPFYIVMQFIDGGSLADRILRCTECRESWPSHREAAELVEKVARTLQYAHKFIVHRDIKPANILLDSRGEPYLADFGLALLEADLLITAGSDQSVVAGTYGYMSPEQARGGSERVDARSDIYSLGVVLYVLLAHQKPFSGSKMEQLKQTAQRDQEVPPLRTDDLEIPAELERICLKALRKDVTGRYTTAHDMAEELAAVIPTLPASPPSGRDRVQHKGLPAYDWEDAGFFLQLLPDWTDGEPTPESIRFWTSWIENARPDAATSRMGLIFGPSGCGKSSLVKAGLLPRLAPHIIPIYVEATAADTERRLLKALRDKSIAIDPDADLAQALKTVSEGRGLPSGSKLLIVPDQFEQWLHAHRQEQDPELVRALVHCDGQHVQGLLMVRDEFWSAVSRLEEKLRLGFEPATGSNFAFKSGENSIFVDRFDQHHAEKVLTLFGQALKALPEDSGQISDPQRQFVQRSVRAMTREDEEGRIDCVRLVLYAQMLKNKAWAPATLRTSEARQVGFNFLETTFNGRTANPTCRRLKEPAKAVLRQLLPDVGEEIKGAMCSEEELQKAAGLEQRAADWKQLVNILDSDLRLITQTDPEGTEAQSSGTGTGTSTTGPREPSPMAVLPVDPRLSGPVPAGVVDLREDQDCQRPRRAAAGRTVWSVDQEAGEPLPAFDV